MKWKDYDEKEQNIKIEKSKTDNGIRTIPLSDILIGIIQSQPRVNEYIFTQTNGNKLTGTVLKKTYLRLRKATGIEDLTIHVCRHTFATRLLEKNADIKSISNLLGHSNPSFTAQRYIHPKTEHLRQQINLLTAV